MLIWKDGLYTDTMPWSQVTRLGTRASYQYKDRLSRYGDSYVKDKTVARLSYLRGSLYWQEDIFILRRPTGRRQSPYWLTAAGVRTPGPNDERWSKTIECKNCKSYVTYCKSYKTVGWKNALPMKIVSARSMCLWWCYIDYIMAGNQAQYGGCWWSIWRH